MLSKTRSRSKIKTSKKNPKHLAAVAKLVCVVSGKRPVTVHHCFTKMGCRKDDNLVIPLHWDFHLGPEGIDGKRMSKRQWEAKYGSEESHLQTVALLLESKR